MTPEVQGVKLEIASNSSAGLDYILNTLNLFDNDHNISEGPSYGQVACVVGSSMEDVLDACETAGAAVKTIAMVAKICVIITTANIEKLVPPGNLL